MLKSIATEIGNLIDANDKKEDANNELSISLGKEIIVGVIRQTIDVEFRGEKIYPTSSIYPIYVANGVYNFNLDPAVSAHDPGPDLTEAIYEELVQNLDGVMNPDGRSDYLEENKGGTSPKIVYAKAVSKNTIEIKFNDNVRASKECVNDVQFDSGNPHICCQIIFREEPLLKGN